MSRRYGALFAVVVAAGLVLTGLARLPRAPRAEAPVAAPLPETAATLELREGTLAPAVLTMPKGHRVRLEIVNHDSSPAQVVLAGYEDRVALTVPAGGRERVAFETDRPGDDFAWLVNRRPAGRFSVTGSHLVEGHR